MSLARRRRVQPTPGGSHIAIHAPAPPADAVWLNVERPLTAADLAGRLVLYHFWTFACINCQHALQSLATIERELAGEPLLIISVHSPKFPAQREAELATEAVHQLEVTHPVVLDPDSRITHSFAVSGWPTMVFVGPTGTILGTLRGEPQPQGLLNVVRQVLAAGKADGSLTGGPLPLRPDKVQPHRLAFPEAVISAGERIVVADSGHHQVVICDLAGQELQRIGTGQPGLADGPAAQAQFRRPCGLALVNTQQGDLLYIADTGNHAVRAVDLGTNLVTTVASAPGLRSPWGLAWSGRWLSIAGAGTHQLWAYDPATGQAEVIAGTGAEGGKDGLVAQAYFAQPSGMAWAETAGRATLYVADAETSSIRAVDGLDDPIRHAGGTTRTICGAGDLFGFGDRDGIGLGVELQHPIGLAVSPSTGQHADTLWVADTFNHKIKRVDPATGSCRSAFGNGDSLLDESSPSGTVLGPAGPDRPLFCVPEAVAVSSDGSKLLVADTGNHRIVAVPLDPGTGPATVLLGGVALC